MTKSAISDSEEYKSFRASVPLKRISIDSDNKVDWQLYCCLFLVFFSFWQWRTNEKDALSYYLLVYYDEMNNGP